MLVFLALQGATQKVETQTDASAEQPTYPPGPDRDYARGQIIVTLEEQAAQGDLTEINQQTGAQTEENLPASDVNVVDLPADLGVGEAVRRYEASPDVEYAEPDYVLQPTQTTTAPSDPSYPKLYGLNNTGQTSGTPDADIDAREAWQTTTGSPSTVVAVIDEGVDIKHQDLRDNIWVNPGEVPGNNVDDDRNGYVDDVNGWDFANDDASVYDPDPVSGKGDEHGTHVAGTIAAEGNNGVGVTGVNWQAKIMPLKFLGPDGGYTSDAVAALNYAVKEGVKVSNNSWGGGGRSQSLQDAITRADASGHLFVAAAGNEGTNNDATPHYPSNYSGQNILSVAATDHADALASFSNFGATTVDLAAPGVNILSTLPGNRYGAYSGTSMATPHVAGVAALLKSQNPALDDAQLRDKILQSVESKGSLQNKVATGGRLNAVSALAPQAAADSSDPTVTAVRPSPSTKDRTPRVTATVSDDSAELTQQDVTLALDGQARANFVYDPSTDRLSYDSAKLSVGKHTIKITATDASGNTATKTTAFKVVRR
jgi:thermitase